jgi:hypothetical protein
MRLKEGDKASYPWHLVEAEPEDDEDQKNQQKLA